MEAVSDSVGTRKVSTAYPPWVAPGATTVTWADAMVAPAISRALDPATTVMIRRMSRGVTKFLRLAGGIGSEQ